MSITFCALYYSLEAVSRQHILFLRREVPDCGITGEGVQYTERNRSEVNG